MRISKAHSLRGKLVKIQSRNFRVRVLAIQVAIAHVISVDNYNIWFLFVNLQTTYIQQHNTQYYNDYVHSHFFLFLSVNKFITALYLKC